MDKRCLYPYLSIFIYILYASLYHLYNLQPHASSQIPWSLSWPGIYKLHSKASFEIRPRPPPPPIPRTPVHLPFIRWFFFPICCLPRLRGTKCKQFIHILSFVGVHRYQERTHARYASVSMVKYFAGGKNVVSSTRCTHFDTNMDKLTPFWIKTIFFKKIKFS